MNRRTACVLFWLTALPVAAQSPPGAVGYLVTQVRDAQGILRQTTDPYYPLEGDMVFFNDHSEKWALLYKMVGSEGPFHTAIIARLPEGRNAIVEAGPNDTLRCRVLEIEPRLHGFVGTVYVRRYKHALAPANSKALTDWCMTQDNKRYALGRLLLQATPIRCRAPLRRDLFGATYLDRDSYLCAELVVAAGTAAGIFDPKLHKANTIYPRDIVFDDINDLSHLYHVVQVWTPTPIGVAPPPRPAQGDRTTSLINALPQPVK